MEPLTTTPPLCSLLFRAALRCTVLAQYGAELAVYFSTVGIELAKHVVPRRLADLQGLVAPAAVEQRLAPGEGVVRPEAAEGQGVGAGGRRRALLRRYTGWQ